MVTRAVKARKKLSRGQKAAIGGVAFVCFILFFMFFPNYGSIKYGFCKTFIELQEPYPQSIQIINAYEEIDYNDSVTISYKKIDPFGLEALNDIQCFFKTEGNHVLLDRVDINGKKKIYPQEAKEVIDRFNLGLQSIVNYPPNLVMPYITTDDIKSYR
jgi:hypothetical protein